MKKLIITVAILSSLGGYAIANDLPVYQPAERASADVLPTYLLSEVGGLAVLPTLVPARKMGSAVKENLPTINDDALPTLSPAQKR